MEKNKAIILDRDGTLNEDQGYAHKVREFKFLSGVIEGLKLLKSDFLFFIISNQSGIGKGFYTIEDFWKFNDYLTTNLKNNNIKIIKTYFCPHKIEDKCICRKPNIKYINDIVSEYNIDLKNSWVIGDHPSDVQLGINAGSKTVYMLTGHGKEHQGDLKKKRIFPTFIAEDFLTAAKYIISNKQ